MKRGRKKKLAISLMDYMGKRRDMKRQLKKEGTAELYEVAVRHFLRFVKNPGFCLADLNRALVIDFITYLQGKGLATNTVNTYISSLRALYNMACQEALIPASYYPFENLKLRRAMTARRAIPASLFQQIAQIKVAMTAFPGDSLLVDTILLSPVPFKPNGPIPPMEWVSGVKAPKTGLDALSSTPPKPAASGSK